MLENYIEKGQIKLGSSDYLFRGITKTKRGEVLQRFGKLSYTCAMELVRERLQEVGLKADAYGLHRFRVGGHSSSEQWSTGQSIQTSWEMAVGDGKGWLHQRHCGVPPVSIQEPGSVKLGRRLVFSHFVSVVFFSQAQDGPSCVRKLFMLMAHQPNMP